jgi:hypothetical protein
MFRHSSWSELADSGAIAIFQPAKRDDHQVATGILLADALDAGRLGLPNDGRCRWIAAAGLVARASNGSAPGTRVGFDLRTARPARADECSHMSFGGKPRFRSRPESAGAMMKPAITERVVHIARSLIMVTINTTPPHERSRHWHNWLRAWSPSRRRNDVGLRCKFRHRVLFFGVLACDKQSSQSATRTPPIRL